MAKSTVEEIRRRFDNDVERFSNLETGQSATMDAPLCMDLVTAAAATTNPAASDLLDVGCGAGNYTLKMLQRLPTLRCTLMDLSEPMLQRAQQRITAAGGVITAAVQNDVRQSSFAAGSFDIILAAAVLHHLRGDEEWLTVFEAMYRWLRPGGSFWVFDHISHDSPAVHSLMQQRHGEHLINLKGGGEAGIAYRDAVFAYVEAEDTPRPLLWQIDLLRRVGFAQIEILHKNGPFAAFGGQKPR
ncbi:MAG: class I SAM-dependent methyltransferase [Phycisphaerales bacterium]|nr:class I SAM-dependent methyltransferase [Phycisphaerales bacterium]